MQNLQSIEMRMNFEIEKGFMLSQVSEEKRTFLSRATVINAMVENKRICQPIRSMSRSFQMMCNHSCVLGILKKKKKSYKVSKGFFKQFHHLHLTNNDPSSSASNQVGVLFMEIFVIEGISSRWGDERFVSKWVMLHHLKSCLKSEERNERL